MSFFHRSGIVNVKMVITEEKILSNIDKIQKLINPNSKKQIVQLEEDSYFRDLVESIKTYLLEYPKKKNFPRNVYKASYDLVEYATNQFEENTRRIELLIRKREKNIKLGSVLRDATAAVKAHAKNWKEIVKKLSTKYPADVAQSLTIIGNSTDTTSEEYQDACKLIDAKIRNLEQNLHIEIDMERIEDRSKALSFIGIEIAEALKFIPAPADDFVTSGNMFESPVEEIETVEEPVAAPVEVAPVEVAPVQVAAAAPAQEIAPVQEVAAPVKEIEVAPVEPVQEVVPVVEQVAAPVVEAVAEPVKAAAEPTSVNVNGIEVNAAFANLFAEAEQIVTPAFGAQNIAPIPDEVTTIDNMDDVLQDALDETYQATELPTTEQLDATVQQAQPVQQVEEPNIVDAMIKEAGLEDNASLVQEQLKEQEAFIEETRFEAKPSLWQRVKNSKLVRTFKYIFAIRIKLDYPALPEGHE